MNLETAVDHSIINHWVIHGDKEGKTIDFMLPKNHAEAAATAFFEKAIL